MILSLGVLFISCLAFSGRVQGQNQCDALVDLTLVIDSSGSISPDDFERAKQALMDLVSRLNVAVNKAGVAVINFSTNMSLSAQNNVFEFDQLELLKQLSVLPRLAGSTATGDALALAKLYCEAQCRDLNNGIPRIFAVFTDGHSNTGQPVIPAAVALREAPIEGTVFAVGVGNIGVDGQAELLGITGDQDYVMTIDSYLDLARITNAISMKMCNIPAFILPDRKIRGEVTGNSSRYYRMNTLHKLAKNAFFEIQINEQAGQTVLFTSTTNKNPTSYSPKSINDRAATTGTGNKTFTTYVPASAKNFYFAIKGGQPNLNKFDFTVRVRPVNF